MDAAVVGSGCAGFNAADWLHDLGVRDIAIITEGVNMGTSRNTGSDKQTYYKLSLASDCEDSVAKLAGDLFAGGGVNGDTAYIEAACSVRSFIKLANLGVMFPTNEYGEYVGYKTDHDPRQRATSAGPLTSRHMTEALERSVRAKKIPILDNTMVIDIVVDENAVNGLICIDKNALSNGYFGLAAVCTQRIILACGGPAAVYSNRVYPESQTGMSGMALLAGARAANLHDWQYGLASIKFRWNVSGTYQQALPRYISIDEDGITREFLPGYFDSPQKALDMVFLKGYQWPFDSAKAKGSSAIDLIVHHEIFNLKRRVYMDFRMDPSGLERGFDGLSKETYDYLSRSNALVKTPVERLLRMNGPAFDLYKNNGIDLRIEPLEISVCAQHHNGGLAVDADWQTGVTGLYAAGECAGTFGTYRPGGSALNSAQVGSLRAAEHIAYSAKPAQPPESLKEYAKPCAELWMKRLGGLMRGKTGWDMSAFAPCMSAYASYVRDINKMKHLAGLIQNEIAGFFKNAYARDINELPKLLKYRDTMITQLAVLSAMIKSAETEGTHGSALVLSAGQAAADCPGSRGLPQNPAYVIPGLTRDPLIPTKPQLDNLLIITQIADDCDVTHFDSHYEPVRPLPKSESWFENVWKEYQNRTSAK